MIALIDTSLWIDFLRPKTAAKLRASLAVHIMDPSAHVAEPVIFEVCRHAVPAKVEQLTRRFQSLPLLPTPANLWPQAIQLGQACRRQGHTAGAIDLLIAVVARSADAVLVTMDADFEKIGAVGGFTIQLLPRTVV